MIQEIRVTNHLNETLKMPLATPELSGFAVKRVDGLGPMKADINLIDLATSDGSIFNGSRAVNRNIVLDLKYMRTHNIESLRQLSYRYFPVKKRLKFTIITDNRSCYIYGYVESNEPSIFEKNSFTKISIICPDPYFYSMEDQAHILSGIEGLFSFPFFNESTVESLLNMGNVVTARTATISYQGDSEIGVMIYIHAKGDVENLSIYNLSTRESMNIEHDKLVALTGSGIVLGDDIIISTIRGEKSITLLRGGVFTNIINALSFPITWFTLSQGDNAFAFGADSGKTNLDFVIRNRIIFEGV